MSGDKWKSQLQLMPLVIQADTTVICNIPCYKANGDVKRNAAGVIQWSDQLRKVWLDVCLHCLPGCLAVWLTDCLSFPV